jgi:hypothetical protein
MKTDGRASRQEAQESADASSDERRRIGRIVHDDRGNASVQWQDAPADIKRPRFEVESATGTYRRLNVGEKPLSLEPQNSFDPYASSRPVERKPTRTSTTSRTDLRKLSEWIKMKRDLEERKTQGDVEDDKD